MKPLVMYCRWHSAKLRLFGRNETSVWGELAFQDHTERFTFLLKEWLLTLGEGSESRTLKLDDMGVEVNK